MKISQFLFPPVTDHTCKGLGEDLMKGYEIVKKLQKNIPDFGKLEKQKSLTSELICTVSLNQLCS